MTAELPGAASVAVDPTRDRMRSWARRYLPRIAETEHGNLNYTSIVTSRLGGSTFFVSDTPVGKPVIPRGEHGMWAARQDAYIADQDMVLVEGRIGPEPDFGVDCRLFIERRQANIPAMQDQLYFDRAGQDRDRGDRADRDGDAGLTVIYTPGLLAPGKPSHRLIMVDLERRVTRVLGSDYFGEAKMGGLRMWNKVVHDRGGLAMHAGAKVFPAEERSDGRERLALIIGLSGTGKTTTTFRQVRGSLPVQDDFVALMPGGRVRTTEAGCFAKTLGLDPESEPTIWEGTTRPDAWLENNAVDPTSGRVDFHDGTYTSNGRATFPLDAIRHREPTDLPTADYLLILNRNETIIPAVARLGPEQAAYYFMLGETRGTSAGGAAEAGRNLRVPGTNPFWFGDDAMQGNRLVELLGGCDLDVYLLNTGWVGGAADDARSRKVRIEHTAAVQEAIVAGTVSWEEDSDFGYRVAADLPGVDDELLRPRLLYERKGRGDEYRGIVERLRAERAAALEAYPSLDERIVAAAR